MATLHARALAVSVCALLFGVSHLASAQDLSRYRDVAFGSSVSAVLAVTAANAADVKLVHQRPALIRELTWRPQYATGRTIGRSEAAREVTFRFYDDELFSIIVVYDPRLVEGLTNADIITAVSDVYGPATLTLPSQPPAAAPPGSINSTTAIARWQSTDHEFTLMREVYPATFRLIGVSTRLAMAARAAEIEAKRLDQQEAPRRLAEQAVADAERKKAAAEKTRTTNKGEFRP
ncbi:MAG TPA: hypothetical protein VFO21_03250 [Vicinamibacterales bacterium]|nr:hypothetical protein [Vicinamibacterales bacterium]